METSTRTGKVAPDGSPDPSIFSKAEEPVGIQVGTAIATLVRKADHLPTESVGFRHLWGQTKLAQLSETAEVDSSALYDILYPNLALGLPFASTAVDQGVAWLAGAARFIPNLVSRNSHRT